MSHNAVGQDEGIQTNFGNILYEEEDQQFNPLTYNNSVRQSYED